MKLAFYKASKGTVLDKLIGCWTNKSFTNLGYSHVEIYFSNKECFSSSPRDNGTRWKFIDDIETSYKWDFIEIDCNYYFEHTLISRCNQEVNKPYDWICIFFTYMIPLNIQNQSSWVCSELVATLVLNLNKPHTFTPNKLYKHLINIHGDIVTDGIIDTLGGGKNA